MRWVGGARRSSSSSTWCRWSASLEAWRSGAVCASLEDWRSGTGWVALGAAARGAGVPWLVRHASAAAQIVVCCPQEGGPYASQPPLHQPCLLTLSAWLNTPWLKALRIMGRLRCCRCSLATLEQALRVDPYAVQFYQEPEQVGGVQSRWVGSGWAGCGAGGWVHACNRRSVGSPWPCCVCREPEQVGGLWGVCGWLASWVAGCVGVGGGALRVQPQGV